jgi:hypothetical protein
VRTDLYFVDLYRSLEVPETNDVTLPFDRTPMRRQSLAKGKAYLNHVHLFTDRTSGVRRDSEMGRNSK